MINSARYYLHVTRGGATRKPVYVMCSHSVSSIYTHIHVYITILRAAAAVYYIHLYYLHSHLQMLLTMAHSAISGFYFLLLLSLLRFFFALARSGML